MSKLKNKLLLIGSAIVSLFAVAVSAIATAAWFQVNYSSNDDQATNKMVTGSTDINVHGVTGYKYNYDEISDTETSSTSGAVIGASDDNVDEDPIEPIDQPTEGVGYYILFEDENGKYKYTNATTVKMDDQYSENYAYLELAVAEGDRLAIRKHTYISDNGETKTSNADLTVFSIATAQKAYFDYPGKNAGGSDDTSKMTTPEFEVLTTGTYHFYINYQEKITWTWHSSTGPSRRNTSSRRITPNRSVYTSNEYKYVYLSPNVWNGDSAKYCAYFYNNSSNAWSTDVRTGSGPCKFTIPTSLSPTHVAFVRKSSSGTAGNWNDRWNQSVGAELKRGLTYTIGSWNSGGWDAGDNMNKESVTVSGFDAGFYIYGTGGEFGSTYTWSYITAVKMDSSISQPSLDQAQLTDHTFQNGTEFRVCYISADGSISSPKNYGGIVDSNSSGAATQNGQNMVCSRTFIGTVTANREDPVKYYLTVGSITITLKYRRFSDSGTWANVVDNTDQSFSPSLTISIGSGDSATSSLSALGTPTISDGSYVWDGKWYSSLSANTVYNGSTFLADGTLYTKFVKPTYTITIKLARTTENSRTNDTTYTGSTTSGTRVGSEEVSVSWLGSTSSGLSLADADYSLIGYFRESQLSVGVFTGNPMVDSTDNYIPNSNETIYKVYGPKVQITIDVVYTDKGTSDKMSTVKGTVSTNTISTKYASGTEWDIDDLDDLTSSYTYSNSNYYLAGYWDAKNGSGVLSSEITSSYTVGGTDTIYKVYRPKLTITIVGVYCIDNTFVQDTGKNTTSTSFALAGVKIKDAADSINGRLPSYDSDYYTVGKYYRYLTGDPISVNIQIYSSGFAAYADTTIYVRFIPKTNLTVTYNYRFYLKNAITGDEVPYEDANENPIISNSTGTYADDAEQYTGIYYRHRYLTSEHAPAHGTAYSFDENDIAGYKFTASGFYTNEGCSTPFIEDGTNNILTSDLELYIKMVAEYEDMHVTVRVGDGSENESRWRNTDGATNRIQIHFVDDVAPVYGTKQDFYTLTRGSDGIFNFRITDGVGFQICNNGAGGNRYTTDYTPHITSYNNNDCNGNARGVCNTIQIITDCTTGGTKNRKWVWSNYYGSDARYANVCSPTSTLRHGMSRGDGVYNMYVYDAGLSVTANQEIILKFFNNDTVTWYGFDDVEGGTEYITDGGTATENAVTGSGSSSTITRDEEEVHKIRFTTAGTYNIYLTAAGKISLASVPATKGEGFYIMSYDVNGNTSSYNGALKMRSTGISGDGNVAYYKYFETTADDQKFYIRSYVNGVDGGTVVNYGSSTDLATMGTGATAGVLNIATAGRYNLYVRKSGSTYTIYLTKIDTSSFNFFTLNKFDGTAESSKNTSLILEVEVSATSEAITKMGANIVRTTTSGGISRYLSFAVYCSKTKLGNTCYDYMRTNYYDAAEAFASNDDKVLSLVHDSTDQDNSIPAGDSTHYYVYIFIDYTEGTNSSTLKSNLSGLSNDFRIVIKGVS